MYSVFPSVTGGRRYGRLSREGTHTVFPSATGGRRYGGESATGGRRYGLGLGST